MFGGLTPGLSYTAGTHSLMRWALLYVCLLHNGMDHFKHKSNHLCSPWKFDICNPVCKFVKMQWVDDRLSQAKRRLTWEQRSLSNNKPAALLSYCSLFLGREASVFRYFYLKMKWVYHPAWYPCIPSDPPQLQQTLSLMVGVGHWKNQLLAQSGMRVNEKV